MKIGTCVTLSAIEDMPAKLKKLRDNDFDSCQILAWEPTLWTKENACILKGLLEEYGITPSAFWCGWEGPQVWDFYGGQLTLGLVPTDFRSMRIKNLCDGADFANMLGITDVITHMGFIPENPYDPNFHTLCMAIRVVANHLQRNGQYLLFETGQETPVTMLRCFEEVGTDNLGVNLDTANLIIYGKANPVDALDVIGKYVRNIHAKDGCYPTNGREIGLERKIGEGKVNFKAFFSKLKELRYDSYVTIEREIKGEQQLVDILEARVYLKNIIDEVYVTEKGEIC